MCTIGLYSYPTLSGAEALLGVHVGHGDKHQSMLSLRIMLPPAADLCQRPSLGRSPDLCPMQQPAELAPVVRPLRMYLRIDGTLEHTSSSFRLRISRTLPRRLCIARNRYRTPGERIQSCLQVGLLRFGTIRDIRYKAGYSPSS